MANPYPLPTVRSRTARIEPAPKITSAPPPRTATASGSQSAPDIPDTAGPRKLVRPTLPARALSGRSFVRRQDGPALAHHEAMAATASLASESSHAEAFYFQKQAQTQTQMVFVLDDGERIEGYIEWYDRNAIKVRGSSRMLIYKSSVKYLYKAGENQQ